MTDVGVNIAFWAMAVVSVGSALAVVLLRNIFRAALFLVLCFVAIAGLYVTLAADFLAAVQILIYAGAIAILIIFAIMLTRDPQAGNPSNRLQASALLVALLFLGAVAYVILNTNWGPVALAPDVPTTARLAEAIFDTERGFVLPFELASIVLLAAMIGAIVLVRER